MERARRFTPTTTVTGLFRARKARLDSWSWARPNCFSSAFTRGAPRSAADPGLKMYHAVGVKRRWTAWLYPRQRPVRFPGSRAVSTPFSLRPAMVPGPAPRPLQRLPSRPRADASGNAETACATESGIRASGRASRVGKPRMPRRLIRDARVGSLELPETAALTHRSAATR